MTVVAAIFTELTASAAAAQPYTIATEIAALALPRNVVFAVSAVLAADSIGDGFSTRLSGNLWESQAAPAPQN
jgi:hypothetical protein